MKKLSVLLLLFALVGCQSKEIIDSGNSSGSANSENNPVVEPTASTSCIHNSTEEIILNSKDNQILIVESFQTVTLEELEITEGEYDDFVNQLEAMYNSVQGSTIFIKRDDDLVDIEFYFDLREVEDPSSYSFTGTGSLLLDENITSLTSLGYSCSLLD